MDDRRISNIGTGLGLVVGIAVGALASVVTGDVVTAVSYGLGGGIVVGALAGRLLRANRGEDALRTRVVGGSGAVGLFVGVAVGTLGASLADASTLSGVAVGAGLGLVHGILVGATLLSSLDDLDSGGKS